MLIYLKLLRQIHSNMYLPKILLRGMNMEYFIVAILFIIGTLLGSFCTLAVYRIPRKKDIIHELSFCPNCEHKLGFLDLIPVLSYIFLGGKCRYCKQKIRPRYLCLEVFSGLTVLLFAISCHIVVQNIQIASLIYLALGILYIVTLTIIAGIDKEFHLVQKGVYIFGLATEVLYILYLYIIEEASIYRYAIYIFFLLVIILLDTLYMKKKKKQNYTLQVLMLCVLLMIFSGTECFVYTVSLTLIAIASHIIYHKIKKMPKKEIPIAFFMCIFNIACLILQNFLLG